MTDRRRLSVILKNIVSNAFRYCDFEKRIRYDQRNAIIKIADNGVDEHHLNEIFDMFYRANEASKGSGLGLYLVKETIDKLNGEIDVNSQIGNGITYTISIPSMRL